MTCISSQSVWFVRYMEFDGRVKEMLRELHHISLATYRSQLIQKIRDYLQLERTSWSVYNPEGGEIGFDLYWPFHWDDLKHLNRLRDINVQKYIDMTKEMIKEYTPEFSYDNDWSIYDIYYKYKPSTDYFNWIPPFKSKLHNLELLLEIMYTIHNAYLYFQPTLQSWAVSTS